MSTIDPKKISQEIKNKYSVANNAFLKSEIKNSELDLYKNEPKDEISIIIGDDKVPDTFLPQIKLCRWTNETNFSLRLIDTKYEKATVETKNDKIKWSKGNVDIEFYDVADGEGSYKMVWFLKEKPISNVLEFSMQSKGLEFYRQPPMTEEHLEVGQTADETHIYDAEGNVVAERPIEIVNSYAVYHSTKGGMNDINGKDYKTGKAFHIFRPHIIDANGAETWGTLHIENGIYSVEIPQEFLDTAVYPIKSNDTFGYTTTGTTAYSLTNYIAGYTGTPAGGNGSVTKISVQMGKVGTTEAKAALYLVSDGSLVNPQSGTTTIVGGWEDLSFSGPSVTNGTAYYVVAWGTGNCSIMGISGAGGGKYQNVTYGAWPATYSPSTSGNSRYLLANLHQFPLVFPLV